MSDTAHVRAAYGLSVLAAFFGWLIGWYMGAEAMEREQADREPLSDTTAIFREEGTGRIISGEPGR